MTVPLVERGARNAVGWTVALAVVWIVVAIARDGTTFHLAPLLVAAAPPLLASFDHELHLERRDVAILTAIGLAAAGIVIAVLALAGAFTGPSLPPFPSAVVEAITLAGAGALVGGAVAWIRR